MPSHQLGGLVTKLNKPFEFLSFGNFRTGPSFLSIVNRIVIIIMEGFADFNRLREEQKFIREQIAFAEDQHRR